MFCQLPNAQEALCPQTPPPSRRPPRAAWFVAQTLVGLLFLSGTGCSWTDKSGTHHLIVGIGFGIVTTTNLAGVEVTDHRVFGGELSVEGSGLGYMRRHRVNINPALASNTVVSINASPFSLEVKSFDPYWKFHPLTNLIVLSTNPQPQTAYEP